MHPIRTAAAAVLAALALACVPALAQDPGLRPRLPTPQTSDAENPPELASVDGLLKTTLTAGQATVVMNGTAYRRNLYNGAYIPPTLRVNPGDSVSLQLRNFISNRQTATTGTWTNLHYHGLSVTPRMPNGDQVVMIRVDSAQSWDYGFSLPPWHPEGLFWYHPHPHGISDDQVAGGMSGALIVGDLLRHFPEWRGVTERVLLIKDFKDAANQTVLNINGAPFSYFTIAPHGAQFWRIANVGSDTYVNLKLADVGGRLQPFTVLARDGNRLYASETVDSLLLPPAARAEVIVRGGTPGSMMHFYSDRIRDVGGDSLQQAVPLALVQSIGTADARGPAAPAPTVDPVLRDSIAKMMRMRVSKVDTLRFRSDFPRFLINDSLYQHDVINRTVALGPDQIQEWVLVNEDTVGEQHVFHIHQGDFLVTEVDGQRLEPRGFNDVVNLGPGSTVKVRIPFRDPLMKGLFVFHCHVLFHEDRGMMQNICVYDPATGVRSCPQPGEHAPAASAAHGHATH